MRLIVNVMMCINTSFIFLYLLTTEAIGHRQHREGNNQLVKVNDRGPFICLHLIAGINLDQKVFIIEQVVDGRIRHVESHALLL